MTENNCFKGRGHSREGAKKILLAKHRMVTGKPFIFIISDLSGADLREGG